MSLLCCQVKIRETCLIKGGTDDALYEIKKKIYITQIRWRVAVARIVTNLVIQASYWMAGNVNDYIFYWFDTPV